MRGSLQPLQDRWILLKTDDLHSAPQTGEEESFLPVWTSCVWVSPRCCRRPQSKYLRSHREPEPQRTHRKDLRAAGKLHSAHLSHLERNGSFRTNTAAPFLLFHRRRNTNVRWKPCDQFQHDAFHRSVVAVDTQLILQLQQLFTRRSAGNHNFL